MGRTYGSPDLLAVETVDRPAVGDGDVLVRVRAAGLDQGVWHTVTGLPYGIRAAGFGLRAPKNPVPGLDVAGTVAAIGRDVTRFQIGDPVFGTGTGGYAAYATAPESSLVVKPPNATYEEAAATPSSATAALQALCGVGRVKADQRVLVIGAGGGVGTFAVQLAAAFGATVTGVCSTSKVDLVRSIGAHDVIDYSREDIADRLCRYDVVIDTGGDRSVAQLRAALAPTGTLVIVGGEGGGQVLGLSRQLQAIALSPFVRQRLGVVFSSPRRTDLELLAAMLADGRVVPVIDRTFTLDEVPEAIRHLRAGRARGKVVIVV
ncbi:MULTISPECIES: NAD(P)-dependent alcohol dehydrogenase [unclassified Modestobacter]|uniref:NAD(P)-dependent alcohol dehydrogenase n=1 Tax=unclassified Modestobacter TaxID=2643866 RepID=UPI0022AABE68|nr:MULTISPECIES: NAD(P)-dependent alcohol dehydrogenase [unclassified Modestobacter]MCZ2825855.1 NAD(P)-dependent alcohol dehydrogenase [Modestobacter sp. VKM Ac-2981]MCZ2853080.1 NAD(P)-dependent alcohol dehydrogenase [Modestobacter sp. VKM Ac-2982]